MVYGREGVFTLREKIKFSAAAVILAILFVLCRLAGAGLREEIRQVRGTAGKTVSVFVVLDAGHGGIDGGKTGVNGEKEKEINLKISLHLKNLLEEEGIQVKMTRSGDERLGKSQVEDLKARVKIMNEEKPALAVSIHQNSYHEENVHGAQVFYYEDSEEGAEAADTVQAALNAIQESNPKEAKSNRSYYILKKTEVPVIIVECGFLSNREEAEKLTDETYQQTVAAAVKDGIINYISQN